MVYSVCLLQYNQHAENESSRCHTGLIQIEVHGTELDDPGRTGVIYHSVHGGRKLVLTVSFCYLEETSSSLPSSNLVPTDCLHK